MSDILIWVFLILMFGELKTVSPKSSFIVTYIFSLIITGVIGFVLYALGVQFIW